MTLNGWQRLWVVLSALWLLLMLVVGWTDWPTAYRVLTSDVFEHMPGDTAKMFIQTSMRPDVPATEVEIDGHIVYFRPGLDESQESQAATAYFDTLQSRLAARRSEFATQVAAVAVLPPIGVYTLGAAFAWVRRGFSSTKS
jgi:hypothetical protein